MQRCRRSRFDKFLIAASVWETHESTVQLLTHLQATGALQSKDTSLQLKRKLQHATEAHGYTQTPYGPVIQKIHIKARALEFREICHPFVFLWYLTHHSVGFRRIMDAITNDSRESNLVIYMDALVPGNPFRPEDSRKFLRIYIGALSSSRSTC